MKYFISYYEDNYNWKRGGVICNAISNVHPFIWLKRERKKQRKYADKWLCSMRQITLITWKELTEKEIKIYEKEK